MRYSLHGGSWAYASTILWSAFRFRGVPGGRYGSIGFRCVREQGSDEIAFLHGGCWYYHPATATNLAWQRFGFLPDDNRSGVFGFRCVREE